MQQQGRSERTVEGPLPCKQLTRFDPRHPRHTCLCFTVGPAFTHMLDSHSVWPIESRPMRQHPQAVAMCVGVAWTASAFMATSMAISTAVSMAVWRAVHPWFLLRSQQTTSMRPLSAVGHTLTSGNSTVLTVGVDDIAFCCLIGTRLAWTSSHACSPQEHRSHILKKSVVSP